MLIFSLRTPPFTYRVDFRVKASANRDVEGEGGSGRGQGAVTGGMNENKKWLREKQKKRGRGMEGIISHAKNYFQPDRIRYMI